MVEKIYHAKNLRENRHEGNGIFFVTKCIQPRKPLLTSEYRKIITDNLLFYAEKNIIELAAFVVMPDHWHAVLASNEAKSIGQTISSIQRLTSRQTKDYLRKHNVSWQKGFYETRVRTLKQFNYICSYIEENPVKKGFTENKCNWIHSSANPEYAHLLACPNLWRTI